MGWAPETYLKFKRNFFVTSCGGKGLWEDGRVVLKGMTRHVSQKITYIDSDIIVATMLSQRVTTFLIMTRYSTFYRNKNKLY